MGYPGRCGTDRRAIIDNAAGAPLGLRIDATKILEWRYTSSMML
jgi:hypothetical protein